MTQRRNPERSREKAKGERRRSHETGIQLESQKRFNPFFSAKIRRWSQQGYILADNLFTTQEDERGGLDSGVIQDTAERIRRLL